MAEWMELVLTALFFFAVLFVYFQFVGPSLDTALGTTSSPGTSG